MNTHLSMITQYPIALSVQVEGKPATIYQKDGRYFIEGEIGKRCAIAVANNSGRRIEVVESVDGRDVLRDAAASLSAGGMIVPSFSRWVNSGWRLNDSQVAEFVFGNPGGSVAAQATGDTVTVGVIGAAVFEEKQRSYTLTTSGIYRDRSADWGRIKGPHYESEVMYGGSTSDSYFGSAVTDSIEETHVSSLSATSKSASPDLGVGMGAVKADHIGHTTFERASNAPAVVVEIQYRSRQWLLDNGVIAETPAFPTAFSDNPTGYAKYLPTRK